MKIKLKLPAISYLLSFICLSTFGQGALTPSGAPAPTMKSLAQIEPRTPISSAPFVITNPGSYYLTTNISVSTSNAIAIIASRVTLDLNGFSILSTAPSANGIGIQLGSGVANISIFNGSIVGSVTNSGGVYGGAGFDSGILYTLDLTDTNTYGLPSNVRVSGVSVARGLNYGIVVGPVST